MGSRRAGLFLSVLALALAGCGDDDDDSGSDEPATVDTQTAVQQDAEAKADARNLTVFVEACFVDNQDYSQCLDAASGEDVGPATLEAPSASHFVVTAPSESGNEFEIANDEAGELVRNCTEPGTGGCGADGSW
ncbi:MAG: hypothetical protein ACRDJY_06565 [Thermoleophilaceae bacterium]